MDKTELKLRKPVTITDNSYGVISPYYSYFNKQYSDFNEEVLKKSDSALIEEAGNDSTIINPQKSSFSKTVYIEFEMNWYKKYFYLSSDYLLFDQTDL